MSKFLQILLWTTILVSCNLDSDHSREYSSIKSIKLDKHLVAVGYNEKTDSCLIEIRFRGNQILSQKVSGKFSELLHADINEDRKTDFFLVVNDAAGLQLHGYSVKRETAEIIQKKNLPGIKNSRIESYALTDRQVVEKIKYTDTDGRSKSRTLEYNLVSDEKGLVLLPQGKDQFELKNRTGQYVTREDNSDFYKVLLIGEREGGQWGVNIKMKKKSNKEVICDFSGLGEYVDGDLYVPLNQADPSLKGILRIRFIDLMAVVYTNNVEDNEEMTFFCNDSGSIAGNFKKTDI